VVRNECIQVIFGVEWLYPGYLWWIRNASRIYFVGNDCFQDMFGVELLYPGYLWCVMNVSRITLV
jgi:hypothetical protein